MNINFLQPKKNKNSNSRGVGFLLFVYAISFVVIFVMLNLSFFFQRFGLITGNFINPDETSETKPSLNHYYHPEEKKRAVVPLEANQNLQADNSIFIPKTGTIAPIVLSKFSDSKNILNDLKNGTVLYPDSALPGNSGTTVILGHSSSNLPWNQFSNVFSKLNNLESGDLIYVKYQGNLFSYKVSQKRIGSVFSLARSEISGDLVLSSCWPVGSDNGRIVISAELQNDLVGLNFAI
ncbi:MAG: hypothetical protein COV30_01170 [Candidatus Yanofskybacteria bacterium CG10_big_fil_rev_8_21_14_0_10_37_15]|uniref:Sortase n=1 Tax=Candidatus Yanofskybacteria bacterium CG10_big_fil_rev_8_21_14_0_10_37_15 TaxID=1975097 RepID=A0A2H0R5Y7_9BACT|nr:MAG: hypothetical protein COV30_01170 [Candidatus Yanofskybacteria bacterium CG10_big_fil_rev_8_21_14_0_10_37_15]